MLACDPHVAFILFVNVFATGVCLRLFTSAYCNILFQGVILYIMVTGFPPYDMPTREDERFEIICHGELMRQLQAWDSKYFIWNCASLSSVNYF